MRINKASSAEDHKLISSFHAVRTTLLKEKYAVRRGKPLVYWALPNDRRLPLAFLGRTIDDLIGTPYDELSATPGIGQKKISTFIKLLQRAVEDEPSIPFGIRELADERPPAADPTEGDDSDSFDPAAVSESLWAKWRQTVRAHSLGKLPLGRLAPSLRELPTVIWRKPLNDYLDHSVAEIRSMKTHGEKRVRVVLEVFHIIHALLADARVADHLEVNLSPRFAARVGAWIVDALQQATPVDVTALRPQVFDPLLQQVKTDAGENVYELAAGRLGLSGAPESVRSQAQRLGVTRARVYQLFDDCAEVMAVRWAEGRIALEVLAQRLVKDRADEASRKMLAATRELFYPEKSEPGDNGRP